MAFRKSWRAYQKRLLDQLDVYLQDRRFHLVAAPGSGKTILGLEVIRRAGQPALVLAPTITIRDQWVERLVGYFLPADAGRPSWISTDIKNPALLTVATYQALHAFCCGQPDKEKEEERDEGEESGSRHIANHGAHESLAAETAMSFSKTLSAAGFRTLVVDEAHHLRAEWWKTLTFVADRLDHLTIIALTATPPYDVSPFEWQRYEELCGPVDAEVSVPELVREGDLCPHQDYVYFSTPAEKEKQILSEFRAGVDAFVQRLKATAEFKNALLLHPWMMFPDSHVEEILDNPAYLSSMLVYLKDNGAEISEQVLEALGLPHKRIPQLNLEWLEILLTNCLYADAKNFPNNEATFKSFRHELLNIGAIEHRKVKLRNPSDQARLLTTSVSKLKSIEEILWLESGSLGSDLRCLVLTDFIRRSEMPSQDGEAVTFEDIGVVPVFESIRRARIKGIRLGVLSGSLVLIPAGCEEILRAAAAALGIRGEALSLIPLRYDAEYRMVHLEGGNSHGIVQLMTSVFDQGGISVLVGTKSLLGEGWDAPCINTLVLASFVGSFVLSNQMRGRSIRTDARRPDKTANIWHLVCLDDDGLGEDYALLARRCRGFVGVGSLEPDISSGTERLGFGQPPFTREQIAQMNAESGKRALDRPGLRARWQKALARRGNQRMSPGLKASKDVLPHGFVLAGTSKSMLVQAGSTFTALWLEFMRSASGVESVQALLRFGAVLAGASAVVSLPWACRAGWRFIRHGTPEGSIRQIGLAILKSLMYEGSLHSGPSSLKQVFAAKNEDGSLLCWIEDNGHEQAAFMRALSQVLGPVDDARFILANSQSWPAVREDYFAVPDVLTRKKEFAEFFADQWRRLVGPVDLVYTRTPEGRRILLRARMHSLTASLEPQSERVSCWK